jgi:RHS repeat-associated protein
LSGSSQGAGGVGGLLCINALSPLASSLFPLYDGNGNILYLVDSATGTTAAQYEYSPFGEPLRATGRAATVNPFRFSTKYTDAETGLLYYGYRYYSPSLRRWLTRDPIEEQGGVNLFGFVLNNSLHYFDSDGRGISSLDSTSGATAAAATDFGAGWVVPAVQVGVPVVVGGGAIAVQMTQSQDQGKADASPVADVTTQKDKCKNKRCRSCTPTRGSIGYLPAPAGTRVRGAHKGNDPAMNHLKTWTMNQIPLGAPNECKCVWNWSGSVEGTLVAPQGWYLLPGYPVPGMPPTGGGVEYY